MDPPELSALQEGDDVAWDAAFDWLWPTAFAVAQLKLQPFFPEDVEDVAIEALEEVVGKVREMKSTEELKPLVASIAHHRAVSLLRERFARKRGAGMTESLDNPPNGAGEPVDPPSEAPLLVELDQNELAGLLRDLQRDLKPEHRALLNDFFLHRLSYEEIARKHGLAMGSVGVYLKRGLEGMRNAATRHPVILKELEAFLR
jgi:RNA polymerase sigma factor (sigma-70 family)